MPRFILVLLTLVFGTLDLFAQDLAGWEKVLLPVVASTEVGGMSNARFVTTTNVFADAPTRYFPRYDFGPGGTVGPPGVASLEPRRVTPVFFPTPRSRNGRLLYLESSTANTVTIAAYLLSSGTGGAMYHETAVPVIRSADFLTGPSQILGVRSSYTYEEIAGTFCRSAVAQFRHTLRVYDVDARGDALVRVRVFLEDGQNSELRTEATLTLAAKEGSDASYPSFVELAIGEWCRPFSCYMPCTGGSQRVEITPLTAGLRYWAMVSATDNSTQQVSLAFPQ